MSVATYQQSTRHILQEGWMEWNPPLLCKCYKGNYTKPTTTWVALFFNFIVFAFFAPSHSLSSSTRVPGRHTVRVVANNDDYAQINHPLTMSRGIQFVLLIETFCSFMLPWSCGCSWDVLCSHLVPWIIISILHFYANRLWFGRKSVSSVVGDMQTHTPEEAFNVFSHSLNYAVLYLRMA